MNRGERYRWLEVRDIESYFCTYLSYPTFERLDTATSFSTWRCYLSMSMSRSSFKVTGSKVKVTAAKKNRPAHVCAPPGHSLILCLLQGVLVAVIYCFANAEVCLSVCYTSTVSKSLGGAVVSVAACGLRDREFDATRCSSCPVKRNGLTS